MRRSPPSSAGPSCSPPLVTLTDAIIALPFAYFMARVATPRVRNALFVAVLLPLWASYLARVYAWIVILTKDGTLDWTTQHLGLGSPNIAYTNVAMWIVFSYIWLPFMILPVYGALERIPDSFIEASADLGARNSRTLRSVVLAPRPAGRGRGVDLHFLAHPRRLHHTTCSSARDRAPTSSATSSTTTSASPTISPLPPRSPSCP